MNSKLICLLALFYLLQLTRPNVSAQSTTGTGDASRENWLPNRGNVGIGTRTPGEALEVVGNVRVSQTVFTNSLETVGLKANTLTVSTDASIGRNLLVTGSIGVGILSPSEKIDVVGNIKASQNLISDKILTGDGQFSRSVLITQNLNVNGNTGLGVASAVEKLEVGGNVKISQALFSDKVNSGDGVFSRNLLVTQGFNVNGNTGLNVASPVERLEVGGNVKVTQSLLSDKINSGDGAFSRNLQVSQNLNVSGNTGLNVASPTEKLEVGGNVKITQSIFSDKVNSGDGAFARGLQVGQNFNVTGNTGLNVTSPTERLEVGGNAKISQTLFSDVINSGEGIFSRGIQATQNLIVNGNTGLGVTTPTEKLEVGGNVKASGNLTAADIHGNAGYFTSLQNSGNLSVNGNLGVGVASPVEKLEVSGNAKVSGNITGADFFGNNGNFASMQTTGNIVANGNMGVGVASPVEKLEVAGNIKATGNLTGADVYGNNGHFSSLQNSGDFNVTGNVGIGVAVPAEKLDVGGNIKASGNLTSANVYAGTGYFSSIQNTGNFNVSGNVGIGVTSPTEKLEVAGNIKSSQNILAQGGQFAGDVTANGNLSVNGNVGVGAAPGNYKLNVGGDTYVNGLLTAENITVKQNLTLNGGFSLTGPLGIGVASPQAPLHVNGDGKFDGNITANKITVNAIEIAGQTQNSGSSGSSLSLGDNLVVNGTIAIGTTKTDGYKLSVNGKIRASDIIKVYPESEWSDFVFDKNYKLRSLEDVAAYIKKHGHLPDMPSAKEVEKEGIDLGSMDAKLLQKIEELTLYVMEMKKENESMKKELNSLKSNASKR